MLNACYILHRRAYRETSLLLDVFTYQHGKISVLAKGAYKAKSARSAQLQPFQPLLMEWVGRSSLKTLSKLEAPKPAFKLHGLKLYAAMYINELLFKLLHEEQPMHSLFEAYIETLDQLSFNDCVDAPLRAFEASLLQSLGLLPDLEHDWQGNQLDPKSTYYLNADGCLVRSVAHEPKGVVLTGTEAKALGRVVEEISIPVEMREKSLSGYDRAEPAPAPSRAIKALLRALIDKALDGRELESRALVKQFIADMKS